MIASKSSKPKFFLRKNCVEEKTLFSDVWLPETPCVLSYLQYFALRLMISLTAFLVFPMIFFGVESIRIIIAIFSVEASASALIYSKIKSRSTTGWLLSSIEDEMIEFASRLGLAGVGALVMISLLA